MKLNSKGFMLAEVVVVAVVVASVLVTLFTSINNLSSAYEIRNRYYDIDSLYVAMDINDILIGESTIDMLENKNVVSLLYNNGYKVDDFMDFYKSNTGYIISSSYFVPYSSHKVEELSNLVINQTYKDYIDYLGGNLDFTLNYDYIIIVERVNVSDSNDCYYYALKLKY